MPILESVFYHNTVQTWIIALGVVVVAFVVLRVLKSIIYRRILAFARRRSTEWDDLVADLVRRTKFFFLLVVSLYAGVHVLTLPETLKAALEKVVIIGILFQGVVWGSVVFDFWIARSRRQKGEEDKASLITFSALGFIGRLVLWSVAVLLVLDNLGINITTLIAGLGVGGIAVALAVQNVLGDLFASMSIILDKPFVIGDFILVDDLRGTVEHIGLKTTRVRSLGGEQIVFANSDLLKSRVKNYKQMAERRIMFTIGVTYQTPLEKLEALPGMIRKIIESQENARFDRSHFREYGDSALLIETVYFVTVADYGVFMDIQQAINLALYRKFAAEGIEFAYPTRTVFLAGPTPSR
ncbi:MAG: mechanosensitive ion channel family protein [Candidatus Aminicenantes bacterium]|nr:mechanosensitive ion channel family protein [Candidatus Aminicenantes bacterium]